MYIICMNEFSHWWMDGKSENEKRTATSMAREEKRMTWNFAINAGFSKTIRSTQNAILSQQPRQQQQATTNLIYCSNSGTSSMEVSVNLLVLLLLFVQYSTVRTLVVWTIHRCNSFTDSKNNLKNNSKKSKRKNFLIFFLISKVIVWF